MPELAAADRGTAQERFDDFFREALERHGRAEVVAGGSIVRRFLIGGSSIDYRFAGPALEPSLTDAIAHLATDAGGSPGFTLHVWDEESTGVGPPPPRWVMTDYTPYGEIPEFVDSNRYLQVLHPRRVVVAAHRPSRQAIVWMAGSTRIEVPERAAPLLALLNWWKSDSGHFFVHAGAVGREDGGVLILGPSGAGKSHTALACLAHGLLYASDDLCLLGTRGTPSAVGLYSTAKLYARDLHRFPFLAERRAEALFTQEGKAVFFMNSILPQRMSPGFPIRAVVLPTPSGQPDTKLSSLPAATALLAAVPMTTLRWPSVAPQAFAGLAGALRGLPCFKLETGTDLRQIPLTIASILDGPTRL